MQPVVMNMFPPEPPTDARHVQSAAASLEDNDAESSLTFMMIERVEETCKAQDARIDSDLASYGRNRASTAGLLDLLHLQYDLDDMQASAMMAKNIADKVGQAINSLTQRN
ncbi:hypothetical protein [Paraburkholderia aromaticivorans]|uniref:hypothetical protein n=1 Tax=Paraburkholderia aromaticivorans TaxID=2026199 RepID=UPI00197FBB34|nr:hypothetical protein [Paraburkholderia aromaticivorans]